MSIKLKVKKSKFKVYVLISILALSIISSVLFNFYGKSFEHFIFGLSKSKFFIGLYLSLYIISSFISIPFLTFLGARVFSFNQAIIYSVIGNMLSAIILFYLVRWLGRDFVRKYERTHRPIKHLRRDFENHSFRDIFLLRLFYPIPPEVANILGGLSEMTFEKYFFSSLMGTMVMTIFSVLLIKSYLWKNHILLMASFAGFIFMLIIPLMFIPKLRKIFRKTKK